MLPLAPRIQDVPQAFLQTHIRPGPDVEDFTSTTSPTKIVKELAGEGGGGGQKNIMILVSHKEVQPARQSRADYSTHCDKGRQCPRPVRKVKVTAIVPRSFV